MVLVVGHLGLGLQVLGIDPGEVQLATQVHGGVLQRLDHREVSVVSLDIFANQGNFDRSLVVLRNDGLPRLPELSALGHTGEGDRDDAEVQSRAQQRDELLLFQEKRDLVDGGHVSNHENLVDLDRTVQSQLRDRALCEGLLAPTSDLGHHQLRLC